MSWNCPLGHGQMGFISSFLLYGFCLFMCWCMCIGRRWIKLVSREQVQYRSCLCVRGLRVLALLRCPHPRSSFPRCPTFPANLLLTLAPNLSQWSLLKGRGLGIWALWQLHRKHSLEQNAEGHSGKSHSAIILLSSCTPGHGSKSPHEHTNTQWCMIYVISKDVFAT